MTDQQIPKTVAERVTWLKDPENREPLRRQGAGSIYYRGDLTDIDSVEVIVSTRSNSVGPGIAHFGGLGEDEDHVEGDILLTGIRNALREGQEEMEELLGYAPDLKEEGYVFLYSANDDKFFINNGHGFAVDARLHAYPAEDDLWTALFPDGATVSLRDENHQGEEETEKAEVHRFKDILKHQDDYHYPHEYFALWVMAAKMMDVDIAELATEVSADMDGARVDFTKLAKDMFVSVADLERYMGAKYDGVLQKYEANFTSVKPQVKAKNGQPRP